MYLGLGLRLSKVLPVFCTRLKVTSALCIFQAGFENRAAQDKTAFIFFTIVERWAYFIFLEYMYIYSTCNQAWLLIFCTNWKFLDTQRKEKKHNIYIIILVYNNTLFTTQNDKDTLCVGFKNSHFMGDIHMY